MCDYDLNIYVHKKMKTTLDNSLKSLKEALPVLENMDDWNESSIHDNLLGLAERLGIKTDKCSGQFALLFQAGRLPPAEQ